MIFRTESCKMFVLMLVTLSLVPRDTRAQPDTWNFHMEDYKDHPCRRPCEENGLPHVCQYDWIVENYFVMSKACHQCPFNLDHCSAPHCIAADGYAKGIKVANRMMPGPAIEVCLGDTIEVTVNNHLESSEGTSIHWHGILQYGSQFMDGVAMVTQCPISFNSKFTYRFNASSAGTHYWHGHAGTQRADGLYGPLIVRQPPSKEIYHTTYDYDLPEHVITITDWTIDMMTNRLAKYVHFDYDNKPRLMLINGESFGACSMRKDCLIPTTGQTTAMSALDVAEHVDHCYLYLLQLGDSTSLAEVKELDRAGKINRTTSQAPLKDTIIIPDGGYTVLRFRADNPGIWLLHCHVEFHAETGMALVFQVGTKEQLPKRPKNFPKCGSWKFEGYEEDDGTPASNQPNITVNVPVPKVEVTCRSNSNSLRTSSIMLMSVTFMAILKSLYF
uniref:Plastocyanin-like domain-containing protein n=1 Tax=Biomphalaria glabrata TaxID=6526 RepID=A0A2C9K905_BIOGL